MRNDRTTAAVECWLTRLAFTQNVTTLQKVPNVAPNSSHTLARNNGADGLVGERPQWNVVPGFKINTYVQSDIARTINCGMYLSALKTDSI
jgi:hypothetical protein